MVTQIAYMCLLGQETVEIGFAGLGVAGKYLMGFNANILADVITCTGMQTISL